MSDTVPIANFRTRMEAEVAAGLLRVGGIPYVIQSAEGMLHGPLGPGATIFVREKDIEEARELLDGSDPGPEERVRAVLVASTATPEDADGTIKCLDGAGIPYLTRSAGGRSSLHVFVRSEHADRARRVLVAEKDET